VRQVGALPWLLAAAPGSALAHSPFQGLSSFLNGILHPLMVPAHLLLLLALGLLIGKHDPARHQPVVLAFLLASIAGLLITHSADVLLLPAVLLASTVVIGLLVVANVPVHPRLLLLAALACGLMLGLDSNPEVYTGKALSGALFGSGIGIYLLLIYPMGLADSMRNRAWQRIGVRVLGSWISASALLVLTLQFAPALNS